MYTIVPVKRKSDVYTHSYMFKDFKEFYEIADYVTYPIFGRYKMGIQSDNIADIKQFLNDAERYSAIDIFLYIPSVTADYLASITTNVSVVQNKSPFDTFHELTIEKELYIEKKILYKLYNSINHDVEDMEEALQELYEEYGPNVEITLAMLRKLFIIEDITFPRQVMLSYLRMDKDRGRKLQKCIEDVGSEVAMWAIRKNVEELVNSKAKYFKSGTTSKYVKDVDTRNLMILYRVFLERESIKDISVLLALYERGLSCYDFIQKGATTKDS